MLETANFRVPWPDWPHPFLTMPTQTFSDQLLIFVNLYPYAKNQVTPSDHSLDTVIFKVPSHGWLHPILTMPAPTIFMKLYQHAKNKLIPLVNSILESNDQIGHINIIKTETVSSICSGEIVHLEIWLTERILACISGTIFFPNDLCRKTANKNFQYRINTVKVKDQIFL